MCVCGGGGVRTADDHVTPPRGLPAFRFIKASPLRAAAASRMADGGRAEAAFMFNDDEYFTSFCTDSAQNLSE